MVIIQLYTKIAMNNPYNIQENSHVSCHICILRGTNNHNNLNILSKRDLTFLITLNWREEEAKGAPTIEHFSNRSIHNAAFMWT